MIGVILIACAIGIAIYQSEQPVSKPTGTNPAPSSQSVPVSEPMALTTLDSLPVKGRAPKTGYTRAMFGDGWISDGICDTRNVILHRDLAQVIVNDKCKVMSGELHDPYSGQDVAFTRGAGTSDDIQIDHVVALSNAWQTGAQLLAPDRRVALANDPLELLAVSGAQNQAKADGDAATWLPPNKSFRCQYVARQIAVKSKYDLWVTPAENEAMRRILADCPNQQLPAPILAAGNN